MAGFPRVSGDFKQVAVYDAPTFTNTGVNAATSGVTVQPQGPKLQFATVTFTGSGDAVLPGAELLIAVETIQQLSTIYLYEFDSSGGAGANTLAVAMYPVAGQDVTNTGAGTLDGELTTALGYAVSVAAGAAFSG